MCGLVVFESLLALPIGDNLMWPITYWKRGLLVAVAAVAFLTLAWLLAAPSQPATANRADIALQAPAFLGIAHAEGASPTVFPADEAGISAYFQAPYPIDLNEVRPVYRSIEAQTADYIIGSVPVPEYPETEDVHVYVHKTGWVLAYYLKTDPTGKIFDWRAYRNDGHNNLTTKLENTLKVVANQISVPYSNVTYYDFRFPAATSMMLIADWVGDERSDSQAVTDNFEVKLPSTLTYLERSWSLGRGVIYPTSECAASYAVNGNQVASFPVDEGWRTSQGTLTASQFRPPNDPNVIASAVDRRYGGGSNEFCTAYSGLSLVYRVQ